MHIITVNNDIKLKLRDITDSEETFALIDSNRSHLRQWLSWVDSVKEVEDVRSSAESAQLQFEANNGAQFGIWLNDKLVGTIAFHYYDWTNRSTSIGYWIDQNYQGQGIMVNSCRALVDYAFADLKMNRVEICCAPQNIRSRAIPQRLGFKEEGKRREVQWLYDHYVDHVVYGILAREWNRGQHIV
jgi:ribosomal-protein-serine acetyltransferase